ncbi:putative LPS assembly protein LptD [Portibacter marinus]|uniref:putative LPS assembly protein LptD n=1 Tax=Portibacter marinus TaxID=2898660 RepID=UPI001F392A4C|nr:putative LPS assembly protein LptD [Portibacter marinus]
MRNRYIYILLLVFSFNLLANGQILDSLEQPELKDTFPIINDSLMSRDFVDPPLPDNVKFSPDAPQSEIIYGATDRKWFDLDSNLVHLYGNAFVEYGTLKLKAGYIVFDFKNNIATAEGIIDSAGTESQRPTFIDGDNQFSYNKLRYNFKSQKGFVYNTYTQEGDLYVQGTQTKFISAESDSTTQYDQIFNKNAIITSCNLDHPHFGIRAQKLKVVPEQLAVLGPARLEIAEIPTPLILPFGFFPLVQGKSSGLIFPDNYEYSEQWGFGLQNIGYYFGINDYIDMKISGDIYLRGSFGLGLETNYTKRYKYRGGLNLSYASRITQRQGELDQPRDNSFRINWTHNQDAKAHPYFKIAGSVNMEFGGFTRQIKTGWQARSRTTQRSNINISHSLPGTPFSTSASFNHSQNLRTGDITMTFPNLQLRMNQVYPFKKKSTQGKPKWYENITLNYGSTAKNYVKAKDSTFFSQQTLDDLEYGVQHKVSSNVSLKVLKYFNFNPSVSYDETWYFRRRQKELLRELLLEETKIDVDPNGDTIFRVDTTFGVLQDTILTQFTPYRNVSASASLTTTIFGTKRFSRGKLRGIRHVIKPSVSLNYQPNNRNLYVEFVETDFRDGFGELEEYSIFPQGVFGTPTINSQGNFNVSYRFKNDMEAKYMSKQDSTLKKIKVFTNWNIAGNYSMFADSLKFSQVSFSTGNTSFLKGIINVGLNLRLDPYQLNENRRRINEFQFAKNKVPLRFDQMNFTMTTRFTVRKIRDLIAGSLKSQDELEDEELENEEESAGRGGRTRGQRTSGTVGRNTEQSFLDLFDNFSINHTFRYTGMDMGTRDTFFVSSNTINLRGNIDLSENWSIRIGNIGYDLKRKGLTYPDFGFERNLHCWNMSFSWQPQFGTYSFFIGVSSNTLNFIKTNYNLNTQDARFRR